MNIYATITDPSGIDYATLYYKIGDNAIEDTTFTGPFNGGYAGIVNGHPEDGVLVRYHIKAVDMLGNYTWSPWDEFTYDGSAPNTTDNVSTTWTNENVTVNLTCTDSISGCNKTYYKINDGEFELYSEPFTFSDTGTYQLRYYSNDNASNVEEVVDGTLVRIDKIAPTSSDNYTNNDVWVNENQTITLIENDEGYSEITIRYCIDTDNTCNPLTGTDYSTPITISDEGTNYLRYQSIDEAGNEEELVNEKIVKIDKKVPITSDDSPTEWKNETFIITLTTTEDSLSPVTTYYKIWNIEESEPEDWTMGNSILVSDDGEYNITYYSKDEAGNIEDESDIKTVHLDTIDPIVTIDEVVTPTNNATQIITGTYTETNIASITINDVVANLSSGTYSAEIVLTEGNNTIKVIATDLAGNSGNTSSLILLDTVKPIVNITLPISNETEVENMDYYVTNANATDSSSGIKNVRVTLLDNEGDVVENLEDTVMIEGTYGYEYRITMWQLESGVYTLIVNATDNAGNYEYDIRTFNVVDNVAASKINVINGTVSTEAGGTVTFRFNVTARGENGIKFGMDNIGSFTPSSLNARISEDETTFAKVGGYDGTNIVNAETLYLTDLNDSLANKQGSFILYLDIPANMIPGTYPITYYIDN